MLERDSTILLKTVLQDADVEYTELDQTALRVFPVRREELFTYDVVIFGDMNPSYLSATVLSNLHDFVEQKGGGVAFIAGPEYLPMGYRNTPLEPLFPIDLARSSAPPRDSRSSKALSCSRPSWDWRALKCNWAIARPKTCESGKICHRSTGCSMPRP